MRITLVMFCLASVLACSAPPVTPVDAGPACSRCAQYKPPVNLGEVKSDALDEASGLAASRAHPGVLWSHNDSDGEPVLYAFSTTGETLGEVHVGGGATNLDWEDVSLGPCAAGTCLYAADIGDNGSNRATPYFVYRVPEPEVSASTPFGVMQAASVEKLELQYPNGEHHDAETLMVHPVSGDLYVVHKGGPGEKSVVYKAAAPLSTTAPNAMTRVLELPLPDGNDLPITGGDIAPCGRAVLLRSYSVVYLLALDEAAGEFDAVFSAQFRRVPTAPIGLDAVSELQGEAVAWEPNAKGFYTVSEGVHPTLHFTGCR